MEEFISLGTGTTDLGHRVPRIFNYCVAFVSTTKGYGGSSESFNKLSKFQDLKASFKKIFRKATVIPRRQIITKNQSL